MSATIQWKDLNHSAAQLDAAVDMVYTHTANAAIHTTQAEKDKLASLENYDDSWIMPEILGVAAHIQEEKQARMDGDAALTAALSTKQDAATAITTDNIKDYAMVLGLANSFSANDDLDTFMTYGTWFTANGAQAGSIQNKPSSVGNENFKLTVFQDAKTAGWIAQILDLCSSHAEQQYHRYYNGTQWGSWKLIRDNLANYQAKLTFDPVPASGSTNPVTSGGVYAALYETGTAIAAQTDLNTLSAPGVYTCSGAAISGTLLHNPVPTAGFRLEVQYLNNHTCIRQTIYPTVSNCTYYVRNYTQNGWSDWFLFSGEAVSLSGLT